MKSFILLILSLSIVFITKGQSFLKPTHTPEFAPYQSTVDVKLYERVIRDKQSKYDQNLESINEYISDIQEYLLELKEYNYENYVSNKGYISEYLKSTFNKKPDLSNQYVYNSIINTLKKYIIALKNNIREYRNAY